MSLMVECKLAITRALGPNRWNDVLQKGGWSKFKKKYLEIATQVKTNEQFKNKYCGERCFIIGNGPSLKTQDLTWLGSEYVFTCNQIMRNPIYPSLKSNFHFFADPTFFELKKESSADMEVLELMRRINTEGNSPVCFFATEGYGFSKEFELDKELDLHYFAHRLEFTDEYDSELQFERFVPNLHTVVHYAIAMAIYMGFKEIYLVGCDCTNVVTAVNTRLRDGNGAEYAYEISQNEKDRMQQRNSKIMMEDELKSFSEVFRAYRLFGEYCAKRGINLVNCTNGGLLDSLPRKKYEEVINQKNEIRK